MIRTSWTWGAIVAWGAGRLAFALGAGSLLGAGAALRGAGVVLITIGAAAVLWGLQSLRLARVVAPRTGIVVALTGVLAAIVSLSVEPERISLLPVGCLALLLLVAAAVCAADIRGGERARDRATRPRSAVIGVLVGATLVGAVVSPALASTPAGRDAPAHHHSVLVEDAHHH